MDAIIRHPFEKHHKKIKVQLKKTIFHKCSKNEWVPFMSGGDLPLKRPASLPPVTAPPTTDRVGATLVAVRH